MLSRSTRFLAVSFVLSLVLFFGLVVVTLLVARPVAVAIALTGSRRLPER